MSQLFLDKLLGSLRACAGASAGALVAAVMITAPDKLEVECSPPRSAHREKNRFYSKAVNKLGLGNPQGSLWGFQQCFRETVVVISFTISVLQIVTGSGAVLV